MMGHRIRKARLLQGITQDMLSNKIGVTKAAISKWENDINPPQLKHLLKIADVLSTPLLWLQTGDESGGKLGVEPCTVTVNLYKRIEFYTNNDTDTNIMDSIENTEQEKAHVPREIMQRHHANAKNTVCLVMRGNSMEPILKDGAVVAINTELKEIYDDKVYALEQNGIIRIKCLRHTPEGICVRSFNKEEYLDENYIPGDTNIRILGLAFWVAQGI